jgi:hypothetical protein
MKSAGELDQSISLELASRIKAEVKACYFNSRKAIMLLDEYATANYLEGFAATYLGMPVEHAWIESDGKILDPTLPRGEAVAYFPGIRVRGREGLEAFYAKHGAEYRKSPLFYAFGWGGSECKPFHSARRASERFCYGNAFDEARKRKKKGN